MKGLFLIMIVLLALPGVALAQSGTSGEKDTVHAITLPEVPVQLKKGPGEDVTASYCSICHSTDYILMQPAFPAEKWAEIVNKMRKVYGAPIPEADAKTIAAYLGAQYGSK